MKNYKDYLELHKVGLVNLFDIITHYIETKLNIKLITLSDGIITNIGVNRKIYQNNKFAVELVVYVTEEGPKFLLGYYTYDTMHYSINNRPAFFILPIPLLYSMKQCIYLKSIIMDDVIIDINQSNSDFIQEYAVDLHKLDIKVLEQAHKIQHELWNG